LYDWLGGTAAEQTPAPYERVQSAYGRCLPEWTRSIGYFDQPRANRDHSRVVAGRAQDSRPCVVSARGGGTLRACSWGRSPRATL